jgi:hypothetical protein
MQDMEPFYRWRTDYTAEEDPRSPFYKRQHSEFHYTHKIYNYYIHPQWDHFGSTTLYCKLLFADYEDGFAIIEFIGEWNDCLYNDIMYFYREVVEKLIDEGISKFVLLCDNLLHFHSGDDDYYVEWAEACLDAGGWVVFVNTRLHVAEEMKNARLYYHVHFSEDFDDIIWQRMKPEAIVYLVEQQLFSGKRQRLLGD